MCPDPVDVDVDDLVGPRQPLAAGEVAGIDFKLTAYWPRRRLYLQFSTGDVVAYDLEDLVHDGFTDAVGALLDDEGVEFTRL